MGKDSDEATSINAYPIVFKIVGDSFSITCIIFLTSVLKPSIISFLSGLTFKDKSFGFLTQVGLDAIKVLTSLRTQRKRAV
jgi:hypothetical protein